jgi:hypothetical protein
MDYARRPRMEIRPTTRAAFEELRTAGDVASVRKIHARVGGSYNLLTAEVRALRVALAEGQAPSAAEAQRPLEGASDRALLAVTPRVAAALDLAVAFLREHPRAYGRLRLWLEQVQGRHGGGPLTDLLAALVGHEA